MTYEGYHQFKNEDGERYGSFEVYRVTQAEFEDSVRRYGDSIDHMEPGWYWAACFPGCVPDGEWERPYRSSRAAYREAMA